jgi:hypothetical protein
MLIDLGPNSKDQRIVTGSLGLNRELLSSLWEGEATSESSSIVSDEKPQVIRIGRSRQILAIVGRQPNGRGEDVVTTNKIAAKMPTQIQQFK